MTARLISTPDGVELALHRMRAYRDGRPAVLLVHGAFTNHRFWLHSEDGTGGMGGMGGMGGRGGWALFLGAGGLAAGLAAPRRQGESGRDPRRGAGTCGDGVRTDTPP